MPGLRPGSKREVFNFKHQEPQLRGTGTKLIRPQITPTGMLARTGWETFPTTDQPASEWFSSISPPAAISPWLKAMRTTCAVLLTSSLCFMFDW
jgi:hypothetical protein